MRQFCLMYVLVLGLIAIQFSPAHAQEPSFQKLEIPADAPFRALAGAIWYPAAATSHPVSLIADNAAFVGQRALVDAMPDNTRHPLVVVSHGFGGNWRNQAWLATTLVRAGYIVAAINHPGTTSRDLEPATGALLWQRAGDISHVISELEGHALWSGHIDRENITVIGHSLGGWTALEVAGARMDADKMTRDCENHPDLAACDVVRDFAIGKTTAERTKLAQDMRDPRIKRVVSLDLGLARGFSEDSLAHINIPVLIIAAGSPTPKVPSELESRYLFDHLPAKFREISVFKNAAHFSFLQLCKANAIALLEDDTPGDGIICKDGINGDRTRIHHAVSQRILAFLAQH